MPYCLPKDLHMANVSNTTITVLSVTGGATALDGLPSFHFAAIPDGLPFVDGDATQYAWLLCESIPKNCLAPFRDLLSELKTSEGVPPVSCVVSDGVMSFTLEAAEELGVPNVLFWTTNACGFLAYAYYCQLVEKGFVPLKCTWTDRVHQVLDILSKPNQHEYKIAPKTS
ncbi:hypothetical protein RJ640_012309 [Escallonia rubra]|uniref:Uncharacterized protein n=1 Tax=Escallonia rubra TaxID=112253 RepID=A0AA88QLQ1_9ASTE|nr:hypothetical protein RJ640_012309 [Escallonia rubra]